MKTQGKQRKNRVEWFSPPVRNLPNFRHHEMGSRVDHYRCFPRDYLVLTCKFCRCTGKSETLILIKPSPENASISGNDVFHATVCALGSFKRQDHNEDFLHNLFLVYLVK